MRLELSEVLQILLLLAATLFENDDSSRLISEGEMPTAVVVLEDGNDILL